MPGIRELFSAGHYVPGSERGQLDTEPGSLHRKISPIVSAIPNATRTRLAGSGVLVLVKDSVILPIPGSMTSTPTLKYPGRSMDTLPTAGGGKQNGMTLLLQALKLPVRVARG